MGLRPREAAPEDVKQQELDEGSEQETDEETLWQELMKMKSDDIRDDIITTMYGGEVNTTVKSAKDKLQSHPRPVVCIGALSVTNRPCVSKTLGSSRCTAVRTPVCQSHALSKGTVAESSVEETLLSVNMPVSSLSLQILISKLVSMSMSNSVSISSSKSKSVLRSMSISMSMLRLDHNS